MIRKLLFPAFAAALLAGCVTGYQYRGGAGDYYYGQPSTHYRHYGAPYGYYGYPGWSGSFGYGYYPYGYYGGYYPYYYGYPYRPPVRPRPDGGHDHQGDSDRPRPPWRDLDRLRERRPQAQDAQPASPRRITTPAPSSAPVPATAPRRGSTLEQRIRRSSQERDRRRIPSP